MTFAEKLKAQREAAGMTQASLAEKAGMNRFGIAKLEQGVNLPSFDSVVKIARALGVDCIAFADCVEAPATSRPKVKPARPRQSSTEANSPSATPAPKKAAKKPKGK